MGKVQFRPMEGMTRVQLAVQELDELVVVEDTYETDHPAVIAALDASPYVERVDKARKPAGGERER